MTGVGRRVGLAVGAITVLAVPVAALLRRDRTRSQIARVDPLTGLGNRTMLTEATHRVLLQLRHLGDQDGSRGPALLLIDLDSFKDVNDVLGHAAGDAVLVQVAAQLQASAGTRALVTRLGGDEFTILFEGP
jgi:diguanylate cyclase (GGDEF)-like protein